MASYPRRAAEPGDENELFALRAAGMRYLLEWVESTERDTFGKQFAASFASPTSPRWVVVEDGEMAGQPIVATLRVERGAREIFVHELVVAPTHQGKGIATFLLRELIDEAMRADVALAINVPPRAQRALRLVRFLGFVNVPSKVPGRSRFVFRT